MLFQPFKRATRPETPAYLQAEIARAQHENRSKMQENALRSQNISGGIELYGEATAPGSPIADYLNTQSAAPVEELSLEGLEGIPNAYTPAGTEAGAVGTDVTAGMAPEFASAGEAAATVAPEAIASEAVAAEGAALMGTEAAAAAAAEAATAAGASAAEIAAAEAAAAAAAGGTGAAAGGAAAGTGALAAMGPVGWAALAALALSYA